MKYTITPRLRWVECPADGSDEGIGFVGRECYGMKTYFKLQQWFAADGWVNKEGEDAGEWRDIKVEWNPK